MCQVEFYTLQYAASLTSMSVTSWSLAAQYLAWCPVHGRAAMRTLLERVPLTSGGLLDERLAKRVLRFCSLYGLQGMWTAITGERDNSDPWSRQLCKHGDGCRASARVRVWRRYDRLHLRGLSCLLPPRLSGGGKVDL